MPQAMNAVLPALMCGEWHPIARDEFSEDYQSLRP